MLNVIQNRILRFAPPLVISTQEIDRGLEIISGMLKEKGLS
jgi:4-aminobutyrate aminotransferase-like enzyme